MKDPKDTDPWEEWYYRWGAGFVMFLLGLAFFGGVIADAIH